MSSGMVGKAVRFPEYNDATGEPITLVGVVEEEFYEPEGEDSYGRLNYRVAVGTGERFTPYAHECSPA